MDSPRMREKNKNSLEERKQQKTHSEREKINNKDTERKRSQRKKEKTTYICMYMHRKFTGVKKRVQVHLVEDSL